MLTFSEQCAICCFSLFDRLFEDCSVFRRWHGDWLQRRAKKYGVNYSRGYSARKDRLVFEYGDRYDISPTLKTVRPDGGVEDTPTLTPGKDKILKTFCFRQWLDDTSRSPEDLQPFVWRDKDGKLALQHIFTGNADQEFRASMSSIEGYKKHFVRIKRCIDPEEEKRRAEETEQVAKDFRRVLSELFKDPKLPEVKYWYDGEKHSRHPVFRGTYWELHGFLSDPGVQRRLMIKHLDHSRLVVFVLNKKRQKCGVKEWDFFYKADCQYVVYRREGQSKHTCVMTLDQFTKDGCAEEDFDISELSTVRCARLCPPAALACGKLGEGYYGKVSLKRDRKGLAAVKEYKYPARDFQALRERALVELIKLRPHPCLVGIRDVYYDSAGPKLFIAMEVCERDLESVLRRSKIGCWALKGWTGKVWMGHVFLGLEHLHRGMEHEVLHRDVKPQNVLLDVRNQAKLTDFGTVRLGGQAKKERGTLTGQTEPPGTPGYIAPELLYESADRVRWKVGEEPPDYSHEVDIYSFGVVCWRLLTRDDVPGEKKTKAFNVLDRSKDPGRLQGQVEETEMDSTAKGFIQGVLALEPEERFDHDQIRRHKFFEDLELPEFGGDDTIRRCKDWCSKSLKDI